ncbi:pseudouridylate synthase 1 homolog isoform X1 [Rhopalosiphum padi]|uniref:pseudouridylate synthase 1 homolog isoform X1 n=2 Tax=Rhopalosiphum padi TaxID=40932 RepID=UPI00298E0F30|nr:pseudouridylate synthase 1 homolog isoform X1 [Rhopalosiphum padi]
MVLSTRYLLKALLPINSVCRTSFGTTRFSVRMMVSDPIINQKHPLSEDDENIATKKLCIEPRVKRKKCAILLAYSGQGYLGLQRNKGTKTVEEELLLALKSKNLITDEGFEQIQTMNFQRAARTDKGVSALRQIISLLLPEDVDKQVINSALPEQIRVLDIRRTTKGFNSKNSCDGRTYSYTCPTFAFAPAEATIDFNYRIDATVIDRINEIVKSFLGCHNYHNYTSKKKPGDPSAQRYMVSFYCDKPYEKDGVELISLYVRGQSFMLHQIRKMVGVIIAICRGVAKHDVIERSWQPDRLDLPIAPGLGLVLEEVHYDKYNGKFGNDGMHERLDFVELNDQVSEFRAKYILPTIIKVEKEESSMQLWLEQLPLHTFEVRTEHRHMRTDVNEINSPGLASLQAAAELIEKEEQHSIDTNREVPPDNLSTLADAAQAMSSENN